MILVTFPAGEQVEINCKEENVKGKTGLRESETKKEINEEDRVEYRLVTLLLGFKVINNRNRSEWKKGSVRIWV